MKTAGTFSQNHLNLGIKTHLNGTLTSNIVIDTSQVAVDTTNRPKRPYRSGLRCADLGLADGARSADATLKDATEAARPRGKAQQAPELLAPRVGFMTVPVVRILPFSHLAREAV
jgi:hypothetical protein